MSRTLLLLSGINLERGLNLNNFSGTQNDGIRSLAPVPQRKLQSNHYRQVRQRIAQAAQAEAEREKVRGITLSNGFQAPRIERPIKRDWLILVPVEGKPEWISVDKIIAAVGAHYGVSRAAMLSPRRNKLLVQARHLAMFMARTMRDDLSLPMIGRLFRRDHSSVMHAVSRVRREWSQFLPVLQSIRAETFPYAPDIK